eukprot:TRINITY_DN73372_c0_g1_i1.p1 TRINITY_DN73372_c0_g1~~TRINITY_DN73372_c0_g1_i1.p1  ORF type:complete len:198 (+),score=73.55 TRINITY_DN73372_c0_g1_i1:57-596(+)
MRAALRRWRGAAATGRGGGPRAPAEQRRGYYWWDSHDSIDDFKAKLAYVLRSEGVINPEHTVEQLVARRRVHSFKDLIQHNLCSLRYFVRPPELITRVYRRVQREVGNETASAGAQEGGGRDGAAEPDDGRLTSAGVYNQYRGVVDPRVLRYQGPNQGNFKQYQDPDMWGGGQGTYSTR